MPTAPTAAREWTVTEMYEELIKRLRERAAWINFPHHGEECPTEDAMLMKQAADAIEELQGRSKVLEKVADKWCETVPKWIPVTERLPEEPYGCLAVVWDNTRYGDGDMFLNYYPEFVGWDGETWNDADGEEIPLDVVYWMKMPQIPEPQMEVSDEDNEW